MALIITAPNEEYTLENSKNVKVFLAGGITNCPDWQSEVIEKINDNYDTDNLTIYNPRRKDFPIDDPTASEKQITWEFFHLQGADIVAFWFSRGSLNPIVLYELGMWGNSRIKEKGMVIGIDQEYERKQDVEIQSRLVNPKIGFVDNLDDFSSAIAELARRVYNGL